MTYVRKQDVFNLIQGELKLKNFLGQTVKDAQRNIETICSGVNKLRTLENEYSAHSKWVDRGGYTGVYCKACKGRTGYKESMRFSYCPYCGALMDEN